MPIAINPFVSDIHRTERTANQKLVEWMNLLIKEKDLPFGFAEQETGGKDRKQPDVILYKSPQSKEIILVIELKPPFFNPLDFEAVQRKAPYFATCNFKNLYLFNTQKVNEMASEIHQLVNRYPLSALEDLEGLEDPSQKTVFLKNLFLFLSDLSGLVFQKKEEKLLSIDEWLVFLLQEHVRVLYGFYCKTIEERYWNDHDFQKQLKIWFNNQGWTFVPQDGFFKRAGRQTAYWLVNKILFYDVLRTTDPQNYPQLKIPEDFNHGGMVKKLVQSYFEQVLKVDYDTIYTTDFIDEAAFPDSKNVIDQIRKMMDDLNRFNFGEIEYEVLGRIFEKLIPAEERHAMGQYFTNPDIVDILLQFAVRDEKDKIFDPGCGAGTFLRRAYALKKLNNALLTHEQLLPTLWGNDIDKFAAGLSTINLAISDLRSKENYPRIIQKDFFEWQPGNVELTPEKKQAFFIPKYFDAIVGNPPYTRQEEMDDQNGKNGKDYKKDLVNIAVLDEAGRPYATLTKRAGLYAYFFVHGTKFLKEGGRFAFIVSNSWLDVDYGKGLQEHFLKYYKIKAILESKVERWFPEADINTCIILMEKASGEENKKAREENQIRFVYLKKPLSAIIPKASNIFEENLDRKIAVENLLQTISAQTGFFENDTLKVALKSQKELWEEGFDKDKNEYIGGKWGKYLRAPPIYFKILERAKDKLVPLNQIANIKRGISTGANEFFYLTEEEIKRKGIEKEFWMHQGELGEWIPNHILHSFKEMSAIKINKEELKYRILLTAKSKSELKKTNFLHYVKDGEKFEFGEKIPAKTDTCRSRGEKWYSLGNDFSAHLFYPRRIGDRFLFPYSEEKIFSSDNLFLVTPKKEQDLLLLAAYLNSIPVALINELSGKKLTGSINVIDMDVMIAEKIPVPDFDKISHEIKEKIKKAFIALIKKPTKNTLEELGNQKIENFDIKNINPDRRNLDNIILSEVFGLTENEQIEIYKAVIDLITNRTISSKSVENKELTKDGINLSLLTKTIIDKIGGAKLGSFYKNQILIRKNLKDFKLPAGDGEIELLPTLVGFRLTGEKGFFDFEIETEAKYVQIFWQAGWEEIKIPETESFSKILPRLEKIIAEIKEAIAYYTDGVLDEKIKKQVEHRVWSEVSLVI